MYLTKTPDFVQNMFPNLVWKMNHSDEKSLYLSFDDGPIPNITPWVLDQLKKYNAKASFFCVGKNVQQNTAIFNRIKSEGHTIGNHTYDHLSGWSTSNLNYFRNVRDCNELVQSNLFRPPYGRLKNKQALFLQRKYKVVMWDVLSGDFDPKLSKDQCLENVISKSKEGSIIVFHDSLKAEDKLRYVLPKVLKHFSKLGFTFKNLERINQY